MRYIRQGEHETPGTFGAQIKALVDSVEVLSNIQIGSWEIKNNQMLFYDKLTDDVIFRYNLFDTNGNPTMKEVYKRELVNS